MYDDELEPISLNYGDLPEREEFLARVTSQLNDGVYPMTIRNPLEWSALAAAINQGIDSYLEAVSCTADEATGRIEILDVPSLYTLARRICERQEDKGMDLLSSIFQTIGYEWI